MTTWHYEHGTWTETTFPDDEGEGTGTWEAQRKHLGYEEHMGIGTDTGMCAFTVNVYSRDQPPRYLIELSDNNLWEAVTAGTLPDALDLLARYAPIVTASEITSAVTDIRGLDSFGIVTD